VPLSINELKTGLTILVDNQVWLIVNLEHVKPGKGAAFVRVKMKNIKTGNVIERTYRTAEKIEEAFIEQKKLQFSYKAGNVYHFMDTENYEEASLRDDELGIAKDLLKDNLEITAYYFNDQLLNINLPTFVAYKIVSTETGLKGDTVKAGTKPAVIESGFTVQVPLFIGVGDAIKVDTRTGEYIERVN